MSVELGDRVKHLIHGFEGIVTGHHRWLTGCDSITVRPEQLRDGKPIDDICVDVTLVTVTQKRAVVLGNAGGTTATDAIPGGPHESPPSRHR
jgi:hypothetical protein